MQSIVFTILYYNKIMFSEKKSFMIYLLYIPTIKHQLQQTHY